MSRQVKLIGAGLGIFLLLLVISGIGLLFYIETDSVQSRIQRQINASLHGTLSWERFRLSLLNSRIELHHVRLTNQAGEELAGVDRLAVSYSLRALLGGTVTLRSVIIEQPSIVIRVNKEGQINLADVVASSRSEPTPQQPTTAAPSIPLVINDFRLTNGAVSFEKESEPLTVVIEGIHLTASGSLPEQSGDMNLQIAKASVNSHTVSMAISEPLTCRAGFANGRIEPFELRTASAPFCMTVSGNVRSVLDKPEVDLQAKVTAVLSEMSNSFPALKEKKFTGNAETHLTIRGTLDNPDVTCQMTYGGGMIAGNQIDRIDLNLQLKDRILTIGKIDITAASGNMNLFGEMDLSRVISDGFAEKNFQAVSYQLNLNQHHIQLEQLMPGAGISGQAERARLTISGSGLTPQTLNAAGELELRVRQLKSPKSDTPIDLSLDAQASISDGQLSIKHLKAQAGAMRLESNGQMNLATQTVNLQLTLNAPDLTASLTPLGLTEIAGSLNAKALIKGNVKFPAIDASITGSGLRFQTITIGNIQCRAETQASGTIKISQLSLENQGSTIQGAGSVSVSDTGLRISDAHLNFRNIEPSDFIQDKTITGIFHGKLTADGTLSSLQAGLSLQAKQLSAKNTLIGDADIGLRLSDGKLQIDKAVIKNRQSELQASGMIQILQDGSGQVIPNPEFQITLNSKALFLEDVIKTMKGRLTLSAHLNGTLNEPQGTIQIQGNLLDFGFQKLQQAEMLSEINKDKLQVKSLKVIVSETGAITGDGWIDRNQAYQFHLASEGILLRHIEVLPPHLGTGKVHFDLSGIGSIENPGVSGNIRLTGLQIQGKSFADVAVQLSVANQTATILAEVSPDLKVNGQFHLKNKDFVGSVQFDHTDLTPYCHLANQNDVSGRITGVIEVKGNADSVRDIEADVSLSEVRVAYQQQPILFAKPFNARFKNQTLNVFDNRISILEQGHMTLNGTGNIGGPLDITLSGEIPLTSLGKMADNFPEAAGHLSLSARLKGTVQQPDLNAQIELKQISMTIPSSMQKLSDLNGRILLTSEAIRFEAIKGKFDTGDIEVFGTINLKNFQPSQILMQARAHAIPITIPQTLDMLLNAELTIHGDADKSLIEGEAVIVEGTYVRNVNLNPLYGLSEMMKKKREPMPAATDEFKNPFLKNMRFDVAVKSREPFLIRNNVAQLDMRPDLRLTGSLRHPILNGRAEAESGTITYQKQTFAIQKGVIDFLNPYKIEPTIDIEGEAQIRKWLVSLKILGTPDDLRLKLTSDPPEEDGDILSLLVFGKTTHELISGEGGAASSPTQILTEMISNSIGQTLKQETGLDVFQVELYDSKDGKDADRVKVTLGKDLSKRMSVKYTVDSKKGELIQRAIAEYKFLEHILISGFQDNRGTFGGEFQFRMEFR